MLVNRQKMVDYRNFERAYQNRRKPSFAQDPRLAKVDVIVDYEYPLTAGGREITIGDYIFATLPEDNFFIHPYSNDTEIKGMIAKLRKLLQKAVTLEEQLIVRFHLPDNKHSFIVKVEMLSNLHSLDSENLCVSHRRLVSHMIFVNVLNDRIKALEEYNSLLEHFWESFNVQFVNNIEGEIRVYGRRLGKKYGDHAKMLFFEFWNECTPLDKIAASALAITDRHERSEDRRVGDLFYYIHEYDYRFNHYSSFSFLHRR